MTITTAQMRAARGLLNWSQSELAERTGISATSIGNIENGNSQPREQTLQQIQRSFEAAGVAFLENSGVRLTYGDVRVFVGREGYLQFFEDVYKTLLSSPYKSVCVSNVDERLFARWHGDQSEEHLQKIPNLSEVSYKILVRDGDEYMPASHYAEYRWLPSELFSSVPFYSYGEKLGIILFEEEPKIILLEYPAITQAYKKQFDAMWEQSRTPTTKKEAS